jgi:signal transduction histidine kinase
MSRGLADPTPRREGSSLLRLIAAFAIIGAGFVTSTIYSEFKATEIDADASDIEQNALPSVEALTALRTSLRHLEVAADQFAEQTVERRERSAADLRDARDQIDRGLVDYLALPTFPHERDLFPSVRQDLADIDTSLARMTALAGKDDEEAKVVADRDVRAAVEAADASLRKLIGFNATHAREALLHIGRVRHRTLWLAFSLDSACILLAITAAVLSVRSLRRQRKIELAHERMLETRAEELELFARRVAHDLLSPLSALSFTLSLVKRNAERGAPLTEPLSRAGACLKRSQRLVDGILDFARAGTVTTAAGARTADLKEAIEGVLEELRADENSGIEIVVPPFEDAAVACSAGVLTSVLSNLLRNATKYMGDRPERKVTVLVQPARDRVHVDVEDTGPGLPPELEEHVFEPYVRARDNTQPGLGLGLATVRRFVEAHGGKVGVRSTPGRGCCFWFELPRVGTADRSGAGKALVS